MIFLTRYVSLFFLLSLGLLQAAPLQCPYAALLKEKSIPVDLNFRFLKAERDHYPKDEQTIAKRNLSVVEGKFVDANGKPFYTEDPARPQSESQEHKGLAMVVLSEEGQLRGTTYRAENTSRHATLVAGQPVKLSIELRTDPTGTPVLLTYRSGHYPHGPWRLKLFIDSLSDQKVNLDQCKVDLSDRTGSLLGKTKIPALWFRDHVKEGMNGDDVLLSFLLQVPPKDYPDSEAPLKDIDSLVSEKRAVERGLKEGTTTVPELVIHFAGWVDHYIASHPRELAPVFDRLVYRLRDAQARDPQDWRPTLLSEIFRRHPALSQSEKDFYILRFATNTDRPASSEKLQMPLVPSTTLAVLENVPQSPESFRLAKPGSPLAPSYRKMGDFIQASPLGERLYLQSEYRKKCEALVQNLTEKGWTVSVSPDRRYVDAYQFEPPAGSGVASFKVDKSTTVLDTLTGEMVMGFQETP